MLQQKIRLMCLTEWNLKNIVPNVVGMSKEDAKLLLDTIGIKIVLKGEGNVKSQSIDPGINVGTSKMIILELS